MELLQLGCKAWETLMQSNAILPSAGRCHRWAKRNPVRLGINQEPETSNLLIGMIYKWWFLENDSKQFHGKWSPCWISLLNFMHCNSSYSVLLGPVLGDPILSNHTVFPLDDVDRWMMRWMSWCYETSWENVTQSLEAKDRWMMKRG